MKEQEEHKYNKKLLKPICKEIMYHLTGYPIGEEDLFSLKSDIGKARLYRIASIAYTGAISQYNLMKREEEIKEVTKDLTTKPSGV